MRDLGTLGGSNSDAYQINEHGQVIGYSYTASGTGEHAVLWSK
jgi:probable HAF family extracellular repeat protein